MFHWLQIIIYVLWTNTVITSFTKKKTLFLSSSTSTNVTILMSVFLGSGGAVGHSFSCWSNFGQPGPKRTGAGWEAPYPKGRPPRIRLHEISHPLQPRLVTTVTFIQKVLHYTVSELYIGLISSSKIILSLSFFSLLVTLWFFLNHNPALIVNHLTNE